MSEKPPAGEAGPVTPVVDPFGKFDGDIPRLEAVVSRHEMAKVIAKARAWESIGRLSILAAMVGVVFVYAMALGVPPPLELALSLVLGKPPGH